MSTPTAKVRVGFWSPLLFSTGGTETWHRTLWNFLDRDRVEIVGLAVLDALQYERATADKLRKIAPVTVGPTALTSLAKSVDVLVMWGIARPQDYFDWEQLVIGPATVFVSHGDGRSTWTCSVIKSAHESGLIDQFVGVSHPALEPITKAGATGIVIHNGVDCQRLDEEVGDWLKFKNRDLKTLGFVGRLSTEKRPECLVEAIARLPINWRGAYVGKDYLEGKIQALANHHCPGRIQFWGQSNMIGADLAAIDALLVPSESEGFGLQIAEAWAAGVPVIATPVGIAAECPQLVRSIPWLPTGLAIAQAVRSDEVDPDGTRARTELAQATAASVFNAHGFGTQWTDLICKLAGR